MKKLTFKVSTPKEGNISGLIKAINKIACQLKLDIENGFVVAENIDESTIDVVIDLINNYYTLLSVDIDNSVKNDVDGSNDEEKVEVSTKKETVSTPKALEPQSEDDLIIRKVEFKNEFIEQLINKLLRTISWAMFKNNATGNEISHFIFSTISEISMNYNNTTCIPVSIGDVVDCNYGTHLPKEINGGHVAAIVCDISFGMVYLVPITKQLDNLVSRSFIQYSVPNDIIYDEKDYVNGTVLLDKGRYLRPERLNQVIGKTTPEFLAEVLHQLSTTFDFTDKIAENSAKSTNFETTTATEAITPEVDETTTTGTTSPEADKPTIAGSSDNGEQQPTVIVSSEAKPEEIISQIATVSTTQKVSNVEKALLESFGSAFDKLDPSKPIQEQIDSFITDIGIPTGEKMLRKTFVIAYDIKKITYENVILELHKMYPTVNEDIIKASLKESFKKWLEQYPELAEKCPKLSLMSVLKAFAKRLV